MNPYTVAAIWMALALIASVISIRAGIAVALAEILVGALAGNLPGVASLAIGFVSFILPFGAARAISYEVLRWNLHAAEIAGVALSTTSVAVVYAVMVETGLNRQELGKLILAACFVTDLGTVLALGALFAGFSIPLVVFAAVTAVALVAISPALRRPSSFFAPDC